MLMYTVNFVIGTDVCRFYIIKWSYDVKCPENGIILQRPSFEGAKAHMADSESLDMSFAGSGKLGVWRALLCSWTWDCSTMWDNGRGLLVLVLTSPHRPFTKGHSSVSLCQKAMEKVPSEMSSHFTFHWIKDRSVGKFLY